MKQFKVMLRDIPQVVLDSKSQTVFKHLGVNVVVKHVRKKVYGKRILSAYRYLLTKHAEVLKKLHPDQEECFRILVTTSSYPPHRKIAVNTTIFLQT